MNQVDGLDYTPEIVLTWDEFDVHITKFINGIKKFKFDENTTILALKRGGFTTATTLSNKLGLPISTVCYQTRDGIDSEPQFLEPSLLIPGNKIIIPDDIYDTGVTVENTITVLVDDYGIALTDILGVFHFSSDHIYSSKMGVYIIGASNKGNWVRFPWE